MDILRKTLAPITDQAWEEINEQANKTLSSVLTARKFVDISGPKGWDYAAVSLGRIDVNEKPSASNVRYGIHRVLPLVETRMSFKLNIWELDNVVRGAEDIDLEPMENAAKRIAEFEEKAIYYGFDKANIDGLTKKASPDKITFPKEINTLPSALSSAVSGFKNTGVEGPYALILSRDKWEKLYGHSNGYPLHQQVEKIIGGPVISCPSISEAILVSQRGDDFKLTIGNDFSIGYETHTSTEVQLYFTESFTFQINDPDAILVLK